ncbi:cytoplasmic dynein 2 intermediate chain 1 isoform X2 [Penaeus vannamei]|uniref:cytoplasmic dynein 2 intermediate chain 1 isoform X2 n=1 Tax=Penaeus vannamei TaxID=6689 RepID=UPI00387F7E2C
MKERERVPKPGGSDRTRPKPSTRPAPGTKEPTSRTRPAPGAPKASSSSSKSSSSGAKASTSGAKSSSSTSKSSSSTSKASSSTSKSSSSRAPASTSRTPASTSRTPASSSKTPATKSSSSRAPPTRSSSKPPSDSSRTPKTAASTSSKSRSSSKLDEKPSASNARPPRPSDKDGSSRRPGDSRSPSKADRESRRGEKAASKSSSGSSSRTSKDPDRSRDEKRRSDPKSSERSSTSKSQKDTSVRKERDKGDSVKSSSRSRRSNDEDSASAAKDRGKGDHAKSSSRSKRSADSEPPSEKAPKEHKEKSKERIKSSKSDRIKSSRTKERSPSEQQDSGVDDVNLKGPVISQNGLGPDMDAVDQNQNSLETMESGISLSSPRDLSEVDVEESISSKMVEVDEMQDADLDDEDEAMIDNEESFLDMEGKFSQNASMDMTGETNQAQGEDDDDNDDYEEDFEDYESDFEDDDGDEDEDDDTDEDEDEDDNDSEAEDVSANEDTEEDSDVGEPDPNMAEVLRALQEENDLKKRLQRTVSFDEPDMDEEPEPDTLPAQDEEPKIEPALETYPTVKPAEAPNQRPKTSRSFVNFAVAKKKQAAAQLSSKMSTRGQKLLNMIQLDTVTVELLTLSPVSYEAYISSFGHSNRQQVSIQTNEDALSEEVQTDEILKRDKWTQKPVHISIGKDDKLPEPEDYLGVGGDMDPIGFTESSTSNTARLTSFLTSASQVMLALLEEELVWELENTKKTNDVETTSDGLGFSHPPVPMGSSVQSLLEGRPSPFVQFCNSEPMMLLSGHGFRNVEEESEDEAKLNESSLICVWWVQEPSRPQHLLSSRSVPTSATFSPGRPSLVLAGLEDGSLAAWDLREPVTLHTQFIEIDGVMWKVRVPSFVTACNEVGDGEGSKIVSIQAVTKQEDMDMNSQGSFQVVTLSRDGRVTWWVVVRVPLVSAVGDILGGKKSGINITKSNSAVVSPHLGASPWSRIALNRSATISVATTLYGEEVLSDAVLCHDLRLDASDPSQLYVATVSGAVAHCSRHSSRMHPRAYLPEIEPGCEALCLALCPHDHRYILVGGSDGVVRLHSTASERPLTSWQSSPDCVPVVDLQWSPARPCVFYVLDANARLHIWDLSAGDIFPVLTVETGGLVGGVLSSFHIAPTKTTSHHPLHGVFANDQGELVLRQVSPEFCTHQVLEDYNTELERFTYYVNII